MINKIAVCAWGFLVGIISFQLTSLYVNRLSDQAFFPLPGVYCVAHLSLLARLSSPPTCRPCHLVLIVKPRARFVASFPSQLWESRNAGQMFFLGKKDRLAATLLAGAETAADLAAGLLSTAELHVGLGLHGL